LNQNLSLKAKGFYFMMEAYEEEHSICIFSQDLEAIEKIFGLKINEISELRDEIINKHLKKMGWKTEC
jgi:hypothetical protein